MFITVVTILLLTQVLLQDITVIKGISTIGVHGKSTECGKLETDEDILECVKKAGENGCSALENIVDNLPSSYNGNTLMLAQSLMHCQSDGRVFVVYEHARKRGYSLSRDDGTVIFDAGMKTGNVHAMRTAVNLLCPTHPQHAIDLVDVAMKTNPSKFYPLITPKLECGLLHKQNKQTYVAALAMTDQFPKGVPEYYGESWFAAGMRGALAAGMNKEAVELGEKCMEKLPEAVYCLLQLYKARGDRVAGRTVTLLKSYYVQLRWWHLKGILTEKLCIDQQWEIQWPSWTARTSQIIEDYPYPKYNTEVVLLSFPEVYISGSKMVLFKPGAIAEAEKCEAVVGQQILDVHDFQEDPVPTDGIKEIILQRTSPVLIPFTEPALVQAAVVSLYHLGVLDNYHTLLVSALIDKSVITKIPFVDDGNLPEIIYLNATQWDYHIRSNLLVLSWRTIDREVKMAVRAAVNITDNILVKYAEKYAVPQELYSELAAAYQTGTVPLQGAKTRPEGSILRPPSPPPPSATSHERQLDDNHCGSLLDCEQVRELVQAAAERQCDVTTDDVGVWMGCAITLQQSDLGTLKGNKTAHCRCGVGLVVLKYHPAAANSELASLLYGCHQSHVEGMSKLWLDELVNVYTHVLTKTGRVTKSDVGVLKSLALEYGLVKLANYASKVMCDGTKDPEQNEEFMNQLIERRPEIFGVLATRAVECFTKLDKAEYAETYGKRIIRDHMHLVPVELQERVYEKVTLAQAHQMDLEDLLETAIECAAKVPGALFCYHKIGEVHRRLSPSTQNLTLLHETFHKSWRILVDGWKIGGQNASLICDEKHTTWRPVWPAWASQHVEEVKVIEESFAVKAKGYYGTGDLPKSAGVEDKIANFEGARFHWPELKFPIRHAVVIKSVDTYISGSRVMPFDATHCESLWVSGIPDHFPDLLRDALATKEIRTIETGIVLHWLSGNHYHFLVESIGKILILKRHGLFPRGGKVLLPPRFNRASKEALQIAGLSEHSVQLDTQKYDYLVKNLIQVEWRESNDTVVNNIKSVWKTQPYEDALFAPEVLDYGEFTHFAPPLFIVKATRDAIIPSVLSEAEMERPPSYIVLIMRKSNIRGVQDYDLLFEAITKQFGNRYAIVQHQANAESELAPQVRRFWGAKMVIGPHGAGFANMIWMQPGSAVVEFPCQWANKYTNYMHLASLLDIGYYTSQQLIMEKFNYVLGVQGVEVVMNVIKKVATDLGDF